MLLGLWHTASDLQFAENTAARRLTGSGALRDSCIPPGQMFFTLMTFEAKRHIATDIHFTLPEGLWAERSEFFKSFGFENAKKSERQYRRGEAEFACAAPISVVWANAISRASGLLGKFSIGGYSSSNQLLFSMKPQCGERV